jgi:hypothetical protein
MVEDFLTVKLQLDAQLKNRQEDHNVEYPADTWVQAAALL